METGLCNFEIIDTIVNDTAFEDLEVGTHTTTVTIV